MGYGCKAYIIDLGGRGGWSGSKTKVKVRNNLIFV